MSTWVTFGSDHADLHPHVGTRLSDGYLAIEAGGYEYERGIANALLGDEFAFDYDKRPTHPGYWKGEIARVVLIDEDQRDAFIVALGVLDAAITLSDDRSLSPTVRLSANNLAELVRNLLGLNNQPDTGQNGDAR